jgi:hypothetical protein
MLDACHEGRLGCRADTCESDRHGQPPGSLCTFRRCTGGSAQDCHELLGSSKVPLNSSRPLRAFPHEGTIVDESPALTAVLQAQRGELYQPAGTGAGCHAAGGRDLGSGVPRRGSRNLG